MSFDLVLFGGTGDLVWRKLMPALFQAFRHGTLPEGGRIIDVGGSDEDAKRPREGRNVATASTRVVTLVSCTPSNHAQRGAAKRAR